MTLGADLLCCSHNVTNLTAITASHAFIDACNHLKVHGSMSYHVLEEGARWRTQSPALVIHPAPPGDNYVEHKALINRSLAHKCSFYQGDACALSKVGM